MSQRNKLLLYVILTIIVIGSIFLIWAIDTGKFFSNADVIDPTINSAKDLNSLPAPDQSTFGEFFGKVASWFGR